MTDRLPISLDKSDRSLWRFCTHDLAVFWEKLLRGSLASRTRTADNRLVDAIIEDLRLRVYRYLEASFPGIAVNEEGISTWPPGNDFCSLDLIDGTKSLLLGMPLFGLQFALVVGEEIQQAAVFLPTEHRLGGGGLYLAKRKAGAVFMLDEDVAVPLQVSKVKELSEATIAFDGPSDDATRLYRHPLASRVPLIRNFSSFCWAGTRLARGNHIPMSIDAVIGLNNKPWDHLPSIALVEEAGGSVTGFHGPHSITNCMDLIFSNGYLHEQIQRALVADPL